MRWKHRRQSVARGLAGTVLYSWDVPGMDAGRASSPSGTVLENPVNPYVGGEMSTARWNGISGAFGLIQAIEPFVLQPALFVVLAFVVKAVERL